MNNVTQMENLTLYSQANASVETTANVTLSRLVSSGEEYLKQVLNIFKGFMKSCCYLILFFKKKRNQIFIILAVLRRNM